MRGFRKTASHDTAVMQKNGVNVADVYDFAVNDRVMTVDGIPGRVAFIDDGPYGLANYFVVLERGMGGGEYSDSQLSRISETTAAATASVSVEAMDILSSIPVEATTNHTAKVDYPELENILEERLPNENIKVFASYDHSTRVKESDPGQNMDQQSGYDSDDVADSGVEQGLPVDEPDDDTESDLDRNDPSACSYCGGTEFEDRQLTGRGTRIRCSRCGGTMKSWGGQWEPEFPNSSQNNASEAGDDRSGGAAGVASLPDANYKTSGIVNWIINKIYDSIEERQHRQFAGKDWADPRNQIQGPAIYNTEIAANDALKAHSSVDDGELGFHLTAAWVDVQAKARRIRREGGVKVVAASKTYVIGEVRGDHNTYETQLNYVPGTKKVADWSCGCKWASFSWGRSKPFAKYEGRLCSHSLALQYEAGARGMYGREIQPDTYRGSEPVTVKWDKVLNDHLTRSSALLDSDDIYPEESTIDLRYPPVCAMAMTMVENNESIIAVAQMLADMGLRRESALDVLTGVLSEVAPHGPQINSEALLGTFEGHRTGEDLYSLTDDDFGSRVAVNEVGDPLPDDGANNWQPEVAHSNSPNPGSTGWATAQDPTNWGRSLITNDFGFTFAESLRTLGDTYDQMHRQGSNKNKTWNPPTYAGVFVKANDTGRILMIQRSISDKDDPAAGTWEAPGGGLEEDDLTPLHGAIREWEEEVGQAFPTGGHVTHIWRSGPYQGYVISIPDESAVKFGGGRSTINPDDPDGDNHEQSAWWEPDHAKKNPALRSELKKINPFDDIKKVAHTFGYDPRVDESWTCPTCASRNAEYDHVCARCNHCGECNKPVGERENHTHDTRPSYREGTLHDEPEPALPTTDGVVDDETGFPIHSEQEPASSILAGNTVDGPHVGADDAASIRFAFLQSSAAIALAEGDTGLIKKAMKEFSFAEQRELIDEGKGDRARNFDRLDIANTHYALINDDGNEDEIIWI